MGLYDRDYLQNDYQPREPSSAANRMMVTNLVILNVAIFLLSLFVGQEEIVVGQQLISRSRLVSWLALTPPDLQQPWMWWRFLTCGFLHNLSDPGHIFWNMFGLFIFGRDVELRYGRQEFLRFYLVAIVLGSLIWCLRWYAIGLGDNPNISLKGASGGVAAVILLFVYNFPHRKILLFFVLPVPAWILGAFLILGDAFGFLGFGGGEGNVAFDVHLVGVAFATAYFWLGWNLGKVTPSGLREGFRWPRFRRGPKLRIHDPNRGDRKREQEADRILEKVGREGLDSLTAKERRILDEHSRRLREKRNL